MSIAGKTIVFTGTLLVSRVAAATVAAAAGANVTTVVSGRTNILVAGTGAGSKIAEAKRRGIAVWTEAQFNSAARGDKAVGSAAPPKSRKRVREEVPVDHNDTTANESLRGKSIVFSGTFSRPSDALKQDAKAAGAKVTDAVSGSTDILVSSSDAGSKMADATSRGITIWTEKQFLSALLASGSLKPRQKQNKSDPPNDPTSMELCLGQTIFREDRKHLPRFYFASKLVFLTSGTFSQDTDEIFCEGRSDETEEDVRAGSHRWLRLLLALHHAKQLVATMTPAFLAAHPSYFGSYVPRTFCFSLPPNVTKPDWTFSDILKASHYKPGPALHLNSQPNMDGVFEAIGRVNNNRRKGASNKLGDETLAEWRSKVKLLPFCADIRVAAGGMNKGEPVEFYCIEDRSARIVSGVYVPKAPSSIR